MRTIDDLVAELQDLDWPDRYRWIVELGIAMPAMPEELRTERNRIVACASRTWLVADSRDHVVWFQGDSESPIVRGLVAMLLEVLQGRAAQEIQGIRTQDIWRRLALDQHMSQQRMRGLQALAARARKLALRSTP